MKTRSRLVMVYFVNFVALMLLSFFAFALPTNRKAIEHFIDEQNLDILYRFMFKFGILILEDNYQILGYFLFSLSLMALVCTLIVHGKYINVYFVNIIFSVLTFFIYPIGTILAPITLTFLYIDYNYNKDYKKYKRTMSLNQNSNSE